MTTNPTWERRRELDAMRADRARLNDELKDVNDRLERKDGNVDGLKERGHNLAKALVKLDELIDAKDAEYRSSILDAYAAGDVGVESGVDGGASGYNPTGMKSSGVVNPLDVDADFLAKVDKSIDAARRGSPGEIKAVVTTGDLGARRAWGVNGLLGPRMLHVVGRAETQPTDSVFAEHPQFTLPAPTAGVGQGVALPEYDAANPGSVTLQRFGRFTDLSRESILSASASSVTQVHNIGIAKDLDSLLQARLETDAGAPSAFQADVKGAIRQRIAEVADNTGAAPTDLVIVANPANVHLLEDVVATGGETIAQPFTRFAGAIVYPTSVQDAGFMLVANLAVGVRFFQARGVQSEQDWNIKTSVLTVATSIIGGYGSNIISGYVKSQDVVTP